MDFTRRQLLATGLGAVGVGALGSSLSNLALASIPEDRYYVFAVFPGAWDVLMSLDPKAESSLSDADLLAGRIERSLTRTDEVDDAMLFDDYGLSFDAAPFGGGLVTTCMHPLTALFEPGGVASGLDDVGMCVVRGMTMDTLTHQVGRRRFLTGIAPSGQNARGSAMATVFAALHTRTEPIPNLVSGPESYNVDRPQWASALSVNGVNDLLRALRPGDIAVAPEERSRIEALLTEFRDCIVARRSRQAQVALDSRDAASGLVTGTLDSAFDLFANTPEMQAIRDRFRIAGNSQSTVEARAAMAAQAIATQTSRVVSYTGSQGLDTHFDNWGDDQFARQYAGFRALSALVEHLADTPHATSGRSMMEHTTIVVYSDFSRTPLFNANGGRDHWLMNSCLLIGKGIHHGIVGESSLEGMAPVAQMVDGAEAYIKPEHIYQALLHDLGLPPDTVDLRVPPYTAVLSS